MFDVRNDPHPHPKGEGTKAIPRVVILLLLGLVLLLSPLARADGPTQDEVFKSISSNVDQSVDGRKMLAVVIAAVAVVMLAVVMNRRQSRAAAPVKLNHQGKLLKELVKRGGLTRAQVKQLKVRADQFSARAEEPLESPVTLLLCPSLLRGGRD